MLVGSDISKSPQTEETGGKGGLGLHVLQTKAAGNVHTVELLATT